MLWVNETIIYILVRNPRLSLLIFEFIAYLLESVFYKIIKVSRLHVHVDKILQ